MFVVPVHLAPLLQHGCAAPMVARERAKLAGMLEEQGVADDGDEWLEMVGNKTLEALSARGEAVARELTKDVPELKQKLRFGGNAKWAGEVGVSTRVLFLAATEGAIIRGRPRGTWISSQYRWSTTVEWLGAPIPHLDPEAARAELVRRWLASYGPGTLTDIKWWTGWTLRHTREALAANGAAEVELDGGTGYVLADDDAPTPSSEPWAALLPALDPTSMGWKERDWYFGDHVADLFDRNGNAGPTVWASGRVVGGWGQRENGTVAVRYLEDIDETHRSLVEAERVRVQAWLGETTVTPRFRTPIDKAIRAGSP